MKCPKCKKDSAFLWNEDGIQEPGRNQTVELKCGGECAGNVKDIMLNDPVHIADLLIDVIVKRGSMMIDEDSIDI